MALNRFAVLSNGAIILKAKVKDNKTKLFTQSKRQRRYLATLGITSDTDAFLLSDYELSLFILGCA